MISGDYGLFAFTLHPEVAVFTQTHVIIEFCKYLWPFT